MKNIVLAGIGLAVIAAGAVYAQNRDAEDAETLQISLQEKAVRIPAREQTAAARAGEGRQTATARVIKRTPNWAAVRADLQKTADEDAESQRQALSDTLTRAPRTRPPAPPGLRALAADRLANVERTEADRVMIPLLIPAHPDVRNKMKLYGMENAYTATADIDADANLSISGACVRVIGGDPNVVEFRKRLAEKPQRLAGIGAPYHISRNDYGVDLSFSKFGCGYVITIECGNPAEDPRCVANDYITMLADSMILANPELAGGE